MVNSSLKNGLVKFERDKLDNSHIERNPNHVLSDSGRFEIYSVLDSNNRVYTIGDTLDNGIISDFFIANEEIYIRHAHIIKTQSEVKLKKICVKL